MSYALLETDRQTLWLTEVLCNQKRSPLVHWILGKLLAKIKRKERYKPFKEIMTDRQTNQPTDGHDEGSTSSEYQVI